MNGSVNEASLCELAGVTGAVPNLREERVPGGNACFMKDVRSTSAVAVLREVSAVPRNRVELVFLWVKVVGRPLSIHVYQWYRSPALFPSAYLVVAYDGVHIH